MWCVTLSLSVCEREMALSLGAICASSCGLLGVCVCVRVAVAVAVSELSV